MTAQTFNTITIRNDGDILTVSLGDAYQEHFLNIDGDRDEMLKFLGKVFTGDVVFRKFNIVTLPLSKETAARNAPTSTYVDYVWSELEENRL